MLDDHESVAAPDFRAGAEVSIGGWGIIELDPDERVVAGKATTVRMGGIAHVMVETPALDGCPAETHFYRADLVRSARMTTEVEAVGAWARHNPEAGRKRAEVEWKMLAAWAGPSRLPEA